MSSPSKRSSAVGASHSDSESTKITPMKLLVAPTTMLASFIRLLGFPGAEAEAELTCMLCKWGMNSWDEMACFAAEDVEKFIVASESAALRQQRLWKQLGFLMEYVRLDREVTPTTSIWLVICAVDEYHTAPHQSDPHPPASPSCMSLHQDKKTIPNLKEFTRKDEDYFSWQDSAVNDLGKAGLIRFTNDPSTITKYPELATSVFYVLWAALKMERHPILQPLSMTTTSATPSNCGRTSSNDMIPRLTVPTWCCLKSKGC